MYDRRTLSYFSEVVFTQPLATGRSIQQVFTKQDPGKNWEITYRNFTEYEMCPYTGKFRTCADCWGGFGEPPIDFCRKKIEKITTGELINRCEDCANAGLPISTITKEEF